MFARRSVGFAALMVGALLVGSVGIARPVERVEVVASFAVLYDFVTFIGGDRVEAVTLMEFGGCPCGWEPAPGDVRKLVDADLFVVLGPLVDPWVERVVAAAANPDLIVVQAAKGVPVRVEEGIGDTHVWFDPINAMLMANTIMHALIEEDPAGEQYYVANATRLQTQLSELNMAITTALADLPRRDYIIWHQALGYFDARYGLVSHPLVRFWLDDPAPGRMAEVIRLGRELGIRYVFVEAPGEEIMEVLAAELGAKVLLFTASPPAPRAPGEVMSAYVAMMRTFLDNLRRALAG